MDIIKQIDKFRDDRNWRQFHNEKDLAISIALEAAELLEVFQWTDSKDAVESKLESIKDELADVMIYSMMLASNLDLDVEQLVLDKLEKNSLKYPVEKSKGKKDKYTEYEKD